MASFRRILSLQSVIAVFIGFVALAAMLAGIFAFVSRQDQDYRDILRLVEGRRVLTGIFSALQDAETGQRGYLLTADERYLLPYDNALAAIHGQFNALANDYAGVAARRGDIEALRNLVDQKLAELRTTIELREAGKPDAALAVVSEGTGQVVMDRIRASMSRLIDAQNTELDVRSAGAWRAGTWLQAGALLSLLVAVGLALLVLRDVRDRIRTLTAAHNELHAANLRLLAEAEQRERLAEQLRQSQKMDAVGQLTGGVAHDFNNMLAIVIGSVNAAKRRLARGKGDLERFLDGALEGAERAASLTHRLLAFSRQQPLAPVPIDPNKMVAAMEEFLRRTLGEQVRLEMVLSGGLWRTHADPSQLENSLLNLAINARDAMPEGGRLTIETSNAFLDDDYVAKHVGVPAGQYVLIAVTDSGAGMGRDILQKVFDPFFTTKPVGKGTGLGLSQVYGFVRQSGGHVKLYSEPGHGTTAKIYLPRFYGRDEAKTPQSVEEATVPEGRPSEIILVAEDEEKVRQLAVETLRDLGYTVLHADGAARALRHLDSNPQVDLLFTDIVMPDVNGRKLAEEAQRRRPGLKILYTTGYTRNAIVHNGTLDQGVDLITKPYPYEQLARKIREVLDRATLQ